MKDGGPPMSVRRAVLTALFATAIVGGTAAAAEVFDGHLEDPVVEEPTTAPDGTTTTLPGDEIELPEGETPEDEESDGVARYYEGCGDFTEGNHGDYVREASQADDRTGKSVSEAAHSPCGKPVSSVQTEPTEEAVTQPEPGTSTTSGQSHGRSGGSHGGSASAPGHAKKR